MKIREVFEYEVDTDNLEEVFTLEDYRQCVDDMTYPFWDGMENPYNVKHSLEIIKDKPKGVVSKDILSKEMFYIMKKLGPLQGTKLVYDHTDLNLQQAKQYYDTYINEEY